MKLKIIMYIVGVILENIYRIARAVMPAFVFALLFKNIINYWIFDVLLSLIMLGGIFYELNMLEFLRELKG